MIIPEITVHPTDTQFVACLRPVLEQEGGNDDDKHDPGGRTSRGIIQIEYDAYRKKIGKPRQDVWLATWAEIFEIYYQNYWLPISIQLWEGCNLMYFDQAVNQGPAQAARNIQRAINNFSDPSMSGRLMRAVGLKSGKLRVDGKIGIKTLYAIGTIRNREGFLKTYYTQDLNFYHSLKNWARYGKGWSNRASAIYKQAVTLARSATGEAMS